MQIEEGEGEIMNFQNCNEIEIRAYIECLSRVRARNEMANNAEVVDLCDRDLAKGRKALTKILKA